MLCSWTITQDLCIRKQLEAGIRYLDFRVGVKNFSGRPNEYEFYLVHGQCAKTLAEELTEVAEFLQDHPREVVLVDCNHCYEFKTPEHTSGLENLILKVSPWFHCSCSKYPCSSFSLLISLFLLKSMQFCTCECLLAVHPRFGHSHCRHHHLLPVPSHS